jgi:hypothetical protein
MSKLKRSVLKSVVKECLLEILSEGIGTRPQQTAALQPLGNAAAQESLNVLQEENRDKEQSKSMKDAIAEITSDPILASVLGDTAQTTLVEQAGADRQGQLRQMTASGPATHASVVQAAESDGESHWAALAFAEKKTI